MLGSADPAKGRCSNMTDESHPQLSPSFVPKKRCTRCGIVKPLEAFRKKSSCRDGYGSWCLECCRANRAEKVEHFRALARGYYQEKRMQEPLHVFDCAYCGAHHEIDVRQGSNRRTRRYCNSKCRRAARTARYVPKPSQLRIPWNKGKTAEQDPRIAAATSNLPQRFKKGHKPWHTGLTHKELPSIPHGPRVNTWKGGVTPEGHQLRQNDQYKQWRLAVYRRDHFTCQHCGVKASGKGTIVAHHIKGWQESPELRYVVENGVTLCRSCHATVDPNIGRTLKPRFNNSNSTPP